MPLDAKSFLERLMHAGEAGAASLRRARRALRGELVHLDALVLIETLATTAYQNWRAEEAGAVPAEAEAPAGSLTALDARGAEALSRSLVAAMILAAQADGAIDAREQDRIAAELEALEPGAGAPALVRDEARAPLEVEALAARARSPLEAMALYTASLLALDVDTPAERGHLARLARTLGLEPGLVRHLHRTVEGATRPAA